MRRSTGSLRERITDDIRRELVAKAPEIAVLFSVFAGFLLPIGTGVQRQQMDPA